MGYEGGNVPKEMADCAMADILSTFRRAAFKVFVVWKEKKTLFRVFSVFFATFWTREFFPCPTLRETLKSQKETENSHSSTPHNNNIIIIR